MPFATVIEHGKTIIVAFYKEGDQWGYPPDHGKKRKDQQRDRIHGLPQRISKCQFDTPPDIFHQLLKAEREFLILDEGFRFFTQVGEYGRTYNEKQVFEERKIEEHHDNTDHDLAHQE